MQKQSPGGVLKKVILKFFAKFAGKHLYWSIYLTKLQTRSFTQNETSAKVFSYEFCKICKSTYFVEHLRTANSGNGYAIASD